MTVRYIADTHLYDPSSLLWRSEFASLDSYAEFLIQRWNETVKVDDLVIHVGDVGNICRSTMDVLRRLNGRKVLVLGNHDTENGYFRWPEDIFQGVYNELRQDGLYIVHNPVVSCPDGSYMIHGHHHIYSDAGMHVALKEYIEDTYRLNCAADLIGNRPLTLRELIICKERLIQSRR